MSFFGLFLCLAVFAIGDILGVGTRAKLSSVFVALMLFLIGFLTGIFPKNIIDQAGLSQIAKWASPFIIFHMGTMINFKELIKEWRTVVLSTIAMGVAAISIFAVLPIIGKESVIVSIPIINGGIVATQIMTEGAMAKGLSQAAALGAIIYAVQKFVGTPPASIFGLKEANILIEKYRGGLIEKGASSVDEGRENRQKNKDVKFFYQKYDKYFTPFTCLGVTAFFAWLSRFLESLTPVNYSIWALLLGAIMGYIGLVPPKILEKGNSAGLLQMAIFASIIPSLADINILDLAKLSLQTAFIFAVVLIGIFIFIYLLPLWKIVGSKNLAVGISMAQLLGFPATYLIANEIATAVAKNEEERELILSKIMPAYVVAGFASVTTLSIVVAGIFVKFL